MHSATLPPRTVPAHRPDARGIDLADTRRRLVDHPLYSLIDSPARLRRFVEHHVFAVWDFQCLLKAMQQRLTCTTVPWLPTPDAEAWDEASRTARGCLESRIQLGTPSPSRP